MTAPLDLDASLPQLRDDLRLLQGAGDGDSFNNWLIFDPVSHRYFAIDGKTLAVLQHWSHGSARAILDALTDSAIDLEDIETIVRFCLTNGLTLDPPSGQSASFVKQADAQKQSIFAKAVHGYLFFKIPLFRPDAFLTKFSRLAAPFFSQSFWVFWAAATVLGLYLALRQWDSFTHTFLHFFNVKGLVFYGLTLVIVKIFHELGHAFAAARYGCRVPTMGVAFLVMFPVLYTDTTDSWKVLSRRQRLTISGAGVAVELMIAGFATLAWAFLPEGPWRSAAFFAATTSWVLSISVNLNPLMRFDGYHFLSDLIAMENLQSRTFALGRWALRERLFGFGDAAPEIIPPARRRWLIFYAFATWVYRFFLFLGIAYLVHEFFFKPLGLFLSTIEIGWFIAMPIFNEMKVWFERRGDFMASRRSVVTAASAFVCALVLLTPWSATVRFPAVLEAGEESHVYPLGAAYVSRMLVESGAVVEAGDPLVELSDPDLVRRETVARRRLALSNARLARVAADAQDRDIVTILEQERIQLQTELTGIAAEKDKMVLRAPIAGVIRDIDRFLHEGRWINESMRVLTIVDQGEVLLRGYISDENASRLELGKRAVFIPDFLETSAIDGRVTALAGASADRISIMALSSQFNGPIAVSDVEEGGRPLQTWYNVTVTPHGPEPMPTTVMRGEVHAKGRRESLATRIWRRVVHVFIKETSI